MSLQRLREPDFRAVCSAALSLSCNLLYALYHAALGIANRSLWFMALFAYYMILSAMRLSALLCERRRGDRDTEDFVAKLCGALLLLLCFVLAALVYISSRQNVAVKHHTIVMITIATYTFYKITAAVLRTIKQRRVAAPLRTVLHRIGCAEVGASLLTLQRSMLVSFGGTDSAESALMNGLTGGAVCTFTLLLGIVTFSQNSRERKISHGTVKARKSKRENRREGRWRI